MKSRYFGVFMYLKGCSAITTLTLSRYTLLADVDYAKHAKVAKGGVRTDQLFLKADGAFQKDVKTISKLIIAR